MWIILMAVIIGIIILSGISNVVNEGLTNMKIGLFSLITWIIFKVAVLVVNDNDSVIYKVLSGFGTLFFIITLICIIIGVYRLIFK